MSETFQVFIEPLIIYLFSLEAASYLVCYRASGKGLPIDNIKSAQALVYSLAAPVMMLLYILKIAIYLLTGVVVFFL